MENKKITVSGRVQGVWFRGYTRKIASSLDIKGYVKNLPNGNVEILAMGNQDKMDKFISKVKVGPPEARVESIEIKEISESIDYENFQISY